MPDSLERKNFVHRNYCTCMYNTMQLIDIPNAHLDEALGVNLAVFTGREGASRPYSTTINTLTTGRTYSGCSQPSHDQRDSCSMYMYMYIDTKRGGRCKPRTKIEFQFVDSDVVSFCTYHR